MSELLEGATPDGLTTGELAERLGVTGQTVRNWQRKGMPALHKPEDPGLPWRFDERACRRWLAANRMEGGPGGERTGAGRKRRRGRPRKGEAQQPWKYADSGGPLIDHAERKARGAQRIAELVERGAAGESEDAIDLATDACKLTWDDLRLLAHLPPEASGLSGAAMARLEKLMAVQARQRELARQAGQLIDVRALREHAADVLGELRAAIEQATRDTAAELARELQADDAGHRTIEAVLRRRAGQLVATIHKLGQAHAGGEG